MLEQALDPYRDNDRQQRGRVVGHDHGDAQEGDVGGARQVDDARVDQGAGDCDGGDLVGFETAGRTDRQHDGQVVEDRVPRGVEDGVGGGIRACPVKGGRQGQGRLNETGTGHCPNEWIDQRRDQRDGAVQEVPPGALRSLVLLSKRGDPAELLVEDGHIVADDDLVLAARLDHGDDALELLDALSRGLGLVLEDEAHTGGAVRHRGDVGLTPHLFQQARRQRRIVRFRHDDPP